MDLSTSLSGAKGFRIVKRGYDPDEVDDFLEQIASGVGELKRKLAEAEDMAVTAAASTPADASPTAAPGGAEAEEIQRALILAQRAADEEVRKATEEGETLLAQAQQRSDELRREAEDDIARRREEGRADLLAEIEELERSRDALANDVVLLERHVDEQREVVQAAIGELQTLLDHPEAFRIAAPTGMSNPSAVDRPLAPVRPSGEAVADEPPARSEPAVAPEPEAVAAAVEEVAPEDPDASGAASSDRLDTEVADPVDDAAAAADDAAEPAPEPAAPEVDEALTPGWDTPPSTVDEPAAPPLFAGPVGGDEDEPDAGPPTEAHDSLAEATGGNEESEDAFLAELRKAMLDEEPLGPRDEVTESGGFADDFGPKARPRFGRRR